MDRVNKITRLFIGCFAFESAVPPRGRFLNYLAKAKTLKVVLIILTIYTRMCLTEDSYLVISRVAVSPTHLREQSLVLGDRVRDGVVAVPADLTQHRFEDARHVYELLDEISA